MSSAVQDRPYQREFCHGSDRFPGVIPAWEGGDNAVLGLLPTGCGKTVCAGMIAKHAKEVLGRRSLILAHREVLISQAADKIGRFGLDVGIEMGDQRVDDFTLFSGGEPDVVVATVQTLQGRRLNKRGQREFGVIVTDECHRSRAASYGRIYDYFQDYYHLGITATADRGDGQNLGAVYSKVAYEYTLRQAIREQWLVPILTARMPCGVNLKDISTTKGDYSVSELEERIAPHIESLCDIVRGEIGTRQTIIFTPDVGSAEATASALNLMGVSAKAVSGRNGKVANKSTLEEFDNFGFQVLVNCDLLIEGWDCPQVACVVVMRPTKQRNRYVQMIGRGTRRYDDPEGNPLKEDCLVIDFAWETTSSHELVTAVELFDDSDTDDEVTQIAAELLVSGKERDPLKAIEKAEEIKRERTTLKIRLTGKRTSYKKIVFDPVGVGSVIGLPIKAGWDFNPANPATGKQVDALTRMGVQDVSGISKTGAGKMLDALIKRREAGLASFKQVSFLANLGVELKQARTLTFAEASKTIDELTSGRRRSA